MFFNSRRKILINSVYLNCLLILVLFSVLPAVSEAGFNLTDWNRTIYSQVSIPLDIFLENNKKNRYFPELVGKIPKYIWQGVQNGIKELYDKCGHKLVHKEVTLDKQGHMFLGFTEKNAHNIKDFYSELENRGITFLTEFNDKNDVDFLFIWDEPILNKETHSIDVTMGIYYPEPNTIYSRDLSLPIGDRTQIKETVVNIILEQCGCE